MDLRGEESGGTSESTGGRGKRRAKEMGVREDEPRYVARLSQAVESCDSLDKVAIGASCSIRLGRLVWGRLLI